MATVPAASTRGNYWEESRAPLASLIFVTPLLLVYEAGVLLMGPEAVRNGAEVWLRHLLMNLGLGQYFFLPVLTVGILLAAHHVSRHRWLVRSSTLWGMFVESLFLAGCLRVLLGLQSLLFQHVSRYVLATGGSGVDFTLAERIVAFVGAGVYEELVFRLILMNLVIIVLQFLRLAPPVTLWGGVLLSSFVFALAHHIGPYGEPLQLFNFLFRFVAGIFFALLFVYRGFGIAAGSLAAYDLMVGLI
ncbi:MAG: CPBP family intramembrane glutamic endopeptidase [Thermogutta sp.]